MQLNENRIEIIFQSLLIISRGKIAAQYHEIHMSDIERQLLCRAL